MIISLKSMYQNFLIKNFEEILLKMNNQIKRTILLKSIDPVALYEKYKNGYTSQLTIPNDKTKMLDPIKLDYQMGLTQHDPRHEITDSSNHKCRFFTTNINDYMKFYDNAQFTRECIKEDEMVNCQLPGCHEKINKKQSIGIPFHMEVLIKDQKCQHVIFSVEGYYCSFEHMYQIVKSKISMPKRYFDGNFTDVDHHARLMFHLMYPNEKFIMKTSDTTLLSQHGGSLDADDLKKHRYVSIPGVITLPAKRQFLQIETLP